MSSQKNQIQQAIDDYVPKTFSRKARCSAFFKRHQRATTWGLGLGAVAMGAGISIFARLLARQPIVPLRGFKPDITILSVDDEKVTSKIAPYATSPGQYSVSQQGGAVHARVGEATVNPDGTVSRPILQYDTSEKLEPGPAHSKATFFYRDPKAGLGLEYEEIFVHSPVGALPTWYVPAAEKPQHDTPEAAKKHWGKDWAVLVHGHGSSRQETMRALPVLQRLGIHALSVAYRNDAGSPQSVDQLYHLGSSEWEDAEAAVKYAKDHGARNVYVVGWSMGGGIALRLSVKSERREDIAGLILDGPAVDWEDILHYHAKSLYVPPLTRKFAVWMLSSKFGHRMLSLSERITLEEMNAKFYVKNLTHPTLLIHSLQDTYVPVKPSQYLAEHNENVDFRPLAKGPHTCEWNVDPIWWEDTVTRWLEQQRG